MKHYRNKKTGVVIKTHSKIVGDNWELVETPAKESKPAPKDKK